MRRTSMFKRLLSAALLLGLSSSAASAQSQSFADFILSVPQAPLPLAATDRIPVVLNNSPFANSTAFVHPGDVFGTVTSVTFTGDGCVFSSTPSAPVTSSGTLPAVLNTQSPATVLAGPVGGLAAKPCFRNLVGSDLPAPTSTTLGGIKSFAAVPHEWINQIATDGTPSATQPAQSVLATISGALVNGHCIEADGSGNLVDSGIAGCAGAGGGSVTSVGLSVPAASLFGVTGSPITTAGTLGLTTAGISGGIPYFSSATQLNSSGALGAHSAVIGGGAGAAPTAVAGCTAGVLAWSSSGSDPTCSRSPTLGAAGL